MSNRALELVERFKAFNKEWIGFVQNCSDENWQKVCPGERWPVGVVARHVAASHYGALGLVKMMAAGQKLPDLAAAMIDQMNLKHAEKHRLCTRDEVLKALRENGASIAEFVAGLSDADLDRTDHFAAAGGEVTTELLIAKIILGAAGDHLAHVKAAAGS